MEITSPGRGVMAKFDGTVTSITSEAIVVNDMTYPIIKSEGNLNNIKEGTFILPSKEVWQEVVVNVGDDVKKKQLLAKGVTKIFFQENVWVFAVLGIIIGSVWGIGKAAVYKHISEYFPEEVGVVGVLGGLGGFVCPIIFGYLLEGTGLWTSCWMFMFLLSAVCFIWMYRVVQRMMRQNNQTLMKHLD